MTYFVTVWPMVSMEQILYDSGRGDVLYQDITEDKAMRTQGPLVTPEGWKPRPVSIPRKEKIIPSNQDVQERHHERGNIQNAP